MARTQAASPDEIRSDTTGVLDEVVVSHLDFFHLEQMSESTWWLGVTKKGKEMHIWIQSNKKGDLTVTVTENELGAAEVTTDQRTP